MGMSKDLMIEKFPVIEDDEDDDFDDFLKNVQADELKIHQPGLVKNRNFLVKF